MIQSLAVQDTQGARHFMYAGGPPVSLPREIEQEDWWTLFSGLLYVRLDGVTRARTPSWSSTPGFDKIGRLLITMADRPEVDNVLLHVTSHGGLATGYESFLSDARAFKDSGKKVFGMVTQAALSGGYYMLMECDAIFAEPDAEVGSLGVFSLLMDTSKFAAEIGWQTVVVSTGGVKGLDFADDVPPALIDERRRVVFELNELFVEAVMAGRALPHAADLFDGSTHVGRHGIDIGLLDDTGTLREVVGEIAGANIDHLLKGK